MDRMPEYVENALKILADFISDSYGNIEQDVGKEKVIYRTTYDEFYVANCAMDSARATAKDACKQIILNLSLL